MRLLTDALEADGLDVLVALDGEAALDIAARVKPDIVLLDALMPGLDGFETCRRLKALPGYDVVPVIFMTALSASEDIVRGFAAGGADYVAKPVIIDAMLARIDAHIANARKIRSAHQALDAADQVLVATDDAGRVNWFTPRALRVLEERYRDAGGSGFRLPVSTGAEAGGSGVQFVRRNAEGENLFRIRPAQDGSAAALVRHLRLTPREAEVAHWMAEGKSNRDIAAILGLSPRTVDKHIEVIFGKLSVENRTAAAAIIFSSLYSALD